MLIGMRGVFWLTAAVYALVFACAFVRQHRDAAGGRPA
jgi:hypothetical protein